MLKSFPKLPDTTNKISFCSNSKKKNINSQNSTQPKNSAQVQNPPLKKKDRKFIAKNYKTSPYYSTSDYIQAYYYFKNARTKDNKGIFNRETLNENLKKYYPEELTYRANDILENNLDKLLKINPRSEYSSYIQTLIELISQGELNHSALRFFSDGWCLSDEIIEDIELFYSAVADNRDKDKLKEELKNLYIPTFKNEKEALEKVKIGDCFLIGDEKNISIKNKDNSTKKLNISKDTYFKLFPPIERFATSQQMMGDCYLIEVLTALYQNPAQRAVILGLFSEDNDGNISIKYPAGLKPVVFNGQNLPDEEDEIFYCAGAKGFKLLEYAYGKTILDAQIEYIRKILKEDEEELENFNNFLELNKDNVYLQDHITDKTPYCSFDEQIEKNKNNGLNNGQTYVQYLIGNGGDPKDVFLNLNYKGVEIKDCFDFDKIKENLHQIGLKEENIMTFATKKHIFGIQIKDDKDKNTTIYSFNPHNQALPCDITEKFKDLIREKAINNFNAVLFD